MTAVRSHAPQLADDVPVEAAAAGDSHVMINGTFERIRYWTGPSTTHNGRTYEGPRRWHCDPAGVNDGPNFGRRLDGHDANWLNMKHIIFPCLDLAAVHWRLIVIHVEERIVSFYDPFASEDTAGDCAAVLQWLQHSIAQYPDRAVAQHPRATDFTAYPGQAQSKTAAMDPGRPIAQGWRMNLRRDVQIGDDAVENALRIPIATRVC